MIWRITWPGHEYWDFGSQQAAFQLLDNYPPHIKEKMSLNELTSEQARGQLQELSHDFSKVSPDSRHAEWLSSRIDFYSKALEGILDTETRIKAEVEKRASQ
jgi:hypothetical protein